MPSVLIAYPQAFNCQSKFDRKLGKVLSKIDQAQLIFQVDENHLIANYAANNEGVNLQQTSQADLSTITHAVIFDDGSSFSEIIASVKAVGLPCRVIRTPITRVINIKNHPELKNVRATPSYEYIGRGSYWGNPYSMYEEGDTREEVMRKYKYDFDFDKFPNKEKSKVTSLQGKKLGCFCKPQACHGDILADYLNSWDDGK